MSARKRKRRLSRKTGQKDFREQHLTPRAIRYGLSRGEFEMQRGAPPGPPAEWPAWRKEAFRDHITAAVYFMRGHDAPAIAQLVERPRVTKSRVNQLVAKGTKFLLDRGYLSRVQS